MRYLIVILMGLTLIACGQASTKTKTDSAAEAVAAFEAYVEALNTGEIETAAAIYDLSPGFHWIERGGIQYESGAAAAQSLKSLSASAGSSKMTVNTMKVSELAEGAVLLSAHFDFAMLSEAGEEQYSFDGWMTIGMAKRDTGWRIAGGQTGLGHPEQ